MELDVRTALMYIEVDQTGRIIVCPDDLRFGQVRADVRALHGPEHVQRLAFSGRRHLDQDRTGLDVGGLGAWAKSQLTSIVVPTVSSRARNLSATRV